ncbi:arsenate reductase, partial [Flavobacteriaceae bacterium]|nr:arsenate reductase [Flavobacteriaceae bacterium]MDC1317593.1 arsenate reductase [Flavobacteriaceae bacterium]
MNKLYYLSSCSTCKRIIKQWSFAKTIDLIDIKKTPINHKDLQELYKITNSYESLFNKRAQMLKKLNLNLNLLDENDFKKLLLSHY